MNISYLLVIISLLFSFFILYILSKNDFVFLRKNITLHNMFDTMILSLLGFLLTARVLFVFGGLHSELYNPITFLHILRYPGILYLGGVIGFAAVSFLRFRKRKIIFHILDIYSLALYPLFLLSLFSSNITGNFLYFNVFIFLLSIFFFSLGIYSYRNIVLKDGSVALLFLCLAAVFTIINEFSGGTRVLFIFTIAQIVSLILFIISSVLLLTHESFLNFKK